MPPAEETVEEAHAEYVKAIEKREEEAARCRSEAWMKWDANVREAKRKLNAAYEREEREKILKRAFELGYPVRHVNGL